MDTEEKKRYDAGWTYIIIKRMRRLSHLKMVALCDQQYGGMKEKNGTLGIVSSLHH